MKYYLTLLGVTVTLWLQAQDLPEFGKPDKQELLMKQCAMDPTAPAMVLSSQGMVNFQYDDSRTTTSTDNSTFITQEEVTTRIKIFTDKGLGYADVKLYYVDKDKYEQVTDVTGYVYNLDEKGGIVTTKLEKELVIRKKETDFVSSVAFSLPGVKPGSVIEYRYNTRKQSFSNIDPWEFQRDIPTGISVFQIEIPEALKFTTQLKANGNTPPVKTVDDYMKTISGARGNPHMRFFRHRYVLRNVDGLKSEPYMAGYRNNLQRITFQLAEIQYSLSDTKTFTTSWESLATDLDQSENFGYQLTKNVSISELDAQLKMITDKAGKIECIHNYVRSHFEWDGVRDFYCLNVKKVNDQRRGSTGDINLLMLNLMLANGIEAWPVLVSTRSNGAVFKNYPFLKQFNTVVVLAKSGDKFYLMDGADKYTGSRLIPPDIMGSEGLIVNKAASDWINIWDANMIEKKNVAYMASLAGDGLFSGDAYLTSSGYARTGRLETIKSNREKYMNEYLASGVTGLKVEQYEMQNTDADTLDLVEKFKFSYKASASGDYLYFTPNLFTGLKENPFTADRRFSDIDFGYNRSLSLTARITIPDNYTVEALPKVGAIMMPNSDIVFTPEYTQDENVIMLRAKLEMNKQIYTVAEYPGLREFYKKMFDMLNDQVVLKKKK